MTRRTALVLLRATVSITLLAFVLSSLDLSEVATRLRLAAPAPLVGVVLVTLAALGVKTVRLQALLSTLGCRVRWRDVLAANLLGGFYNLVLPGVVGGDVARGWRLKTLTNKTARTAVSVAADRITGLIALVLLCVGALWLAPAFPGRDVLRLTAVGLLGALALVVALSLAPRRRRAASGETVGFLRRFTAQADEALQAYRDRPSALCGALGLGLILQILVALTNYLACRAFGLQISPVNVLWVTAAVSLALSLPISVAGLGVRETAYVVLLGHCGADPSQALGVSLVTLAVFVSCGLAGGVLQLLGLGARPQESAPGPLASQEAE
ncbi:MAG: lysylphosphatidylglycerol synthase transmembrane domain-containing protein [Armatimonadota bacterium]